MDAGEKVATYTYDQQNQLVRADDQGSGVSTVYTYDAGGNITAVKTYAYTTGELGAQTGENSYSYGDDNWKDLLTDYNGQAISYDEIEDVPGAVEFRKHRNAPDIAGYQAQAIFVPCWAGISSS